MIVGDYLNNQIRRYSPDGKILGSFYRPNSTGQPYSIGMDPRNGDIYVPEIADGQPGNKVAQYTKDGTFVKALTLSGIDYQAWITIDGAGNLIQADSHYSQQLEQPAARCGSGGSRTARTPSRSTSGRPAPRAAMCRGSTASTWTPPATSG